LPFRNDSDNAALCFEAIRWLLPICARYLSAGVRVLLALKIFVVEVMIFIAVMRQLFTY
jgi:hypothetical protein